MVLGLGSAMRGGIKPPPRPEWADRLPMRQLPFAPSLYLVLGRGPDARAGLRVREGDEVVRGQVLAESAETGGSIVHAAATGRVVRVFEQADDDGGSQTLLRLDPYSGDTQEQASTGDCDPAAVPGPELLKRLQASGLVGLGGEGEATHERLRRAGERGVEVLVINAVEGESLFGQVPALLQSQGGEVQTGIAALASILGTRQSLLAVEAPDAAQAKAMAASIPGLSVCHLAPRYPQGEQSLLLRALARQQRGFAPERAAVFSLATVAEAGRLLRQGQVMTEQWVSLVGEGLSEPGHYRMALGTPLIFALQYAGLISGPVRVLNGGPMRGEAVASLDRPIGKGATGFCVLDETQRPAAPEPSACIRCGECVAACPVGLHPAELGLLARRGELKTMHEDYHLERCFECGCCAYVCPSHIPLVQMFRMAKRQWQRVQPATGNGGGA